MIAISEAEDEGLYTCIISNEEHERIRELLFEVDVTTTETVTSLRYSVNHPKSCIMLEFDLPESAELAFANFAPFFVVVHENGTNKSLNSLPIMAKCSFRRHCKLEICQSSGMLEDATEYVFRISMVLSGSGTVITPLSKPVIAKTWDSVAKKSLPLQISYNESENSITVTWDIPTDVKGVAESFVVQVINYSDHPSNLLAPVEREYYERPLEQRMHQIFNVTLPFVYKFRVIPLTRSGKLPKATLPYLEVFPFMVFTSEQILVDTKPELLIPSFSLTQPKHDPAIHVSWSLLPNEASDSSHRILISYQSAVNTRSKFHSVEWPINGENSGDTTLTKGIEVGLVYQVCASSIRRDFHEQSRLACKFIAVKNDANALIFATYKEASNRLLLPPAIACENGESRWWIDKLPAFTLVSDTCRCFPSKINEGGMRIEWDEPPPRKDELPAAEINYIIYYTFNETDANNREYEM